MISGLPTGWAGFALVSGASLLTLVVLQAITFAVGHRIGRYNVVDVSWGLGLVLVSWVALVVGGGDDLRRWLLAALITIWGLRVTWHVHSKTRGKGEDPRYVAHLGRAGVSIPAQDVRQLLVVARKVFAIQGTSQWLISLPIQISAVLGPTTGWGWILLGLGASAWVVGICFEAIGDAQLRSFKADPAHKGLVMDRGLWAWTRHPNYFGDACVWWGLWLITLSAASSAGIAGVALLLTAVSPLAMTYFLVFATGARLLEKSMQERPGYPEYQARTSFFIPPAAKELAQ